MKLIDDLEKSVTESMEMDKKRTYSGKLFGRIGLVCNLFALLLSFLAGICFLAKSDVGIIVWMWVLYFVAGLLVPGMFFSVRQRLRGKYLSVDFSIWFGIFCILIMLGLIIAQVVLFGKVYIYPFVTP